MDYRDFLRQMQEQSNRQMMADLQASMPKPSMAAPEVNIPAPSIEAPQIPAPDGMSPQAAMGLMNAGINMMSNDMQVPQLTVQRGGGMIPMQAPQMSSTSGGDLLGMLSDMALTNAEGLSGGMMSNSGTPTGLFDMIINMINKKGI